MNDRITGERFEATLRSAHANAEAIIVAPKGLNHLMQTLIIAPASRLVDRVMDCGVRSAEAIVALLDGVQPHDAACRKSSRRDELSQPH